MCALGESFKAATTFLKVAYQENYFTVPLFLLPHNHQLAHSWGMRCGEKGFE